MTKSASLEIVIAHYNEDLSWIEDDLDITTIYSKGGEDNAPPYPHIKLPNIGREGQTYLHHIFERYDTLADVTLFLQGRVDDHFSISFDEVKDRARKTAPGQVTTFPYRELETFDHWDGIPWNDYPSWKKWSTMSKWQLADKTPAEYWRIFFPGRPIPASCGFQPGALFAVRKEEIQQYPRSTYELMMREWFGGQNAHINPETGHHCERLWQGIFSEEYRCMDLEKDISKTERNQWGQLAKGRWHVTPRNLEIDEKTLHPLHQKVVEPVVQVVQLATPPTSENGSTSP